MPKAPRTPWKRGWKDCKSEDWTCAAKRHLLYVQGSCCTHETSKLGYLSKTRTMRIPVDKPSLATGKSYPWMTGYRWLMLLRKGESVFSIVKPPDKLSSPKQAALFMYIHIHAQATLNYSADYIYTYVMVCDNNKKEIHLRGSSWGDTEVGGGRMNRKYSK